MRDLSRKQKAAIRVKGESGKPTTNSAIYGYKKDPQDKDHWLVDDEAADVVRRIYRLTVEGHGPYEIAAILDRDRVEIPAVYAARHGGGIWKSKEDFPTPYAWSGFTVETILAKPEYMGDTVNFRSYKESYKDKKRIQNPPEKWLVFKDTHEAIVDRETWELAQSLRRTPRRIDTFGEANPFTGLVYCADCGAKMYNHRSRGNPDGSNSRSRKYPTDFFECSAYTLATQKRVKACRSHAITTKSIRRLVLESISRAAEFALSDREGFAAKVREAANIKRDSDAKAARRMLAKSRKRHGELDAVISKLYESYALGRVSEERFDALLAGYEAEQAALKAAICEAEGQLANYDEDTDRVAQFLALAEKYADFSELTTPMINEFVDRIVVHASEKVDGERTQEVEIFLKFVGDCEFPTPEPTPDEIAEQERLRKERARSRERYQRDKRGEVVHGTSFEMVCQFCGKPFTAGNYHAKYCSPSCRQKDYRRQKKRKPAPEKTCPVCGRSFTPSRPYMVYCCQSCRKKANNRKAAERRKGARDDAAGQ